MTTLIRVLGGLEVSHNGSVVPITAAKHRHLLATLVSAGPAGGSADRIVDDLWPQEVPASATKLVQVYVSQLRKLLPDTVTIRTTNTGYAVALQGAEVDAQRFEADIAAAAAATSRGEHAAAADLLRRALDWWRGPAYEEFREAPLLAASAERLEELRRATLEQWIAAEVTAGRCEAVLPELPAVMARHPLREGLQEQCIRALYVAGRRSDALHAWSRVRRGLVDELGLEPGPRLQDLHARMLRDDPTLRSALASVVRRSSLPRPPSTLIGRDRELAELSGLLRRETVRLVVLTGPGGSGKTRLALEVARRLQPDYPGGAFFVGLESVRDPSLVLPAVAAAVGTSGQDNAQALAAGFGEHPALLVLDNMEQVAEAGPEIARLLALAPGLTVLATSRAVLRLTGEHVVPVGPLPAPAATELFHDRAAAADPAYRPVSVDETVVRDICGRLDDLPLAIELAAAKVRMFAPEELRQRLSDSMVTLSDGPRDLPERQRGLEATLRWSFDQLQPADREVAAALSVFATGWDLVSAEVVADAQPAQLARLVEHSLLVRTEQDGHSSYRMLATVREYAGRLLSRSPGRGEVRRRHAEHVAAVTASFNLSPDALAAGRPPRHAEAAAWEPEVRVALEWAVECNPLLGLEIVSNLEQHWIVSDAGTGRQWLQRLLARAGDLPDDRRARALRDLGGCCQISGDVETAMELYRQSRECLRRLGDERGVAELAQRLATCYLDRRDPEPAAALAAEALPIARETGSVFLESILLEILSVTAYHAGEVAEAYRLELESARLTRSLGVWPWGQAIQLANLGEYALSLGRLEEAEAHLGEALALCEGIGDRANALFAVATLAGVLRCRGEDERAGFAWGAADGTAERGGIGRWSVMREECLALLGPSPSEKLQAALAAGRSWAMSPDGPEDDRVRQLRADVGGLWWARPDHVAKTGREMTG